MTIPPETLTITLLGYSVVFVIIGLFFFYHCMRAINRVHDMVESVINLINIVEKHYEEDIKREGTD